MLPRRRETKLKRKNESDREIRKSGGTNRNKQWDKKARTLQSNIVPRANIAGTFGGRALTIVSRLFQGCRRITVSLWVPESDGPASSNAEKLETVGEGSILSTLDPSGGNREDNRQLLNARPIPACVVPMVCHRQATV
jgi:hypothetical protein